MTNSAAAADPQGIDQQLDAGVTENDHELDMKPEDARTGRTLRTDPDDPAEAMRAADEASTSADDTAAEQD